MIRCGLKKLCVLCEVKFAFVDLVGDDFCSGEKLLDTNWCESIEVKGKVRLEAFEKYIQDLPRS